MPRCLTVALFVFGVLAPPALAVVTFDWATIGNPGNSSDFRHRPIGVGAVDYTYRIGRHEVTNAQYTEFLNAVASTDPFYLYNPNMGLRTWGGITRSGSEGNYTYSVKEPAIGRGPAGTDYAYDKKPVVYVSFFDAMRFANWLHNGQGSGDTETGVYTIDRGYTEVRSSDARFWIPNIDEWYKAGHFDPHANGGSGAYYDYPTSTNEVPNNNLPDADTGNSANFVADFFVGPYTTGDSAYPMTDVGAYSLSQSPYGTFDQGGNVWEWNETDLWDKYGAVPTSPQSKFRGISGSSWYMVSSRMVGNYGKNYGFAYEESNSVGFRVASAIPEPATLTLAAAACLAIVKRWRSRLA